MNRFVIALSVIGIVAIAALILMYSAVLPSFSALWGSHKSPTTFQFQGKTYIKLTQATDAPMYEYSPQDQKPDDPDDVVTIIPSGYSGDRLRQYAQTMRANFLGGKATIIRDRWVSGEGDNNVYFMLSVFYTPERNLGEVNFLKIFVLPTGELVMDMYTAKIKDDDKNFSKTEEFVKTKSEQAERDFLEAVFPTPLEIKQG